MPRYLPLFQPIMSSTITLPHIDGGHEEGHQTRRDLVASAVDSVRRFKQSWISIMILKAGIGLGQVSLAHFVITPSIR